jgi:hypothetical protein
MSLSGLRLIGHKTAMYSGREIPIENLLGRFRFKRQIYFPGLAECFFLAAFDFETAYLDRTGRAERFFLVGFVRHVTTHNFSVGIYRNDERTPVTAE